MSYADCCGKYHDGEVWPETAEQLMRTRYAAYVLGDVNYLLDTWHATTRPPALNLDDQDSVQWLGLTIVRVESGAVTDSDGIVEFVARYKLNGKAVRMREVSRFVREAGRWLYVDGVIE